MLTKLRYVGVQTEDLIDVYKLFIRSIIEYCSVVYHSRLTEEQSNKLKRIQKTCLKIILSEMYVEYESALEMTGLSSLKSRRIRRCLDFSLKSIKHPKNKKMFPASDKNPLYKMREKEAFKVNFARTTSYKNSTIPYCQRLLNQHFLQKKWKFQKIIDQISFLITVNDNLPP